jgi:IstB-like ATP binding protein
MAESGGKDTPGHCAPGDKGITRRSYGLDVRPRRIAEGRLDERLGFFAKPKLLIIDELGTCRSPRILFCQLVSRRYERGSVPITSNRAVGEWGSVFGDPVVATAILDRLLHRSHQSPSAATAIGYARRAAPRRLSATRRRSRESPGLSQVDH